ncbi:class I SAM-dependent methyltransferase [Streptomyces sp. ODS28]|uniref:class I SAM-dependent DNA methyltransferase n=1 Tax=Streptomyces sp. ODS28 TaxID=3136688 RepID=UPI0031E9CA87
MSEPSTLMDSGYAGMYSDMYARHWWWRAREENVKHTVRRHRTWRRGHAKILDVGCADGLNWRSLREEGDIEGIEPDASLLAPGSPHLPRIEVADFLRGRPRAADHDLMVMLDVLEHIGDERAALDRVRRLLAPHGRFLLTVPALPVLWSEFDTLSGHFRRYTRASLRAALEGAGLRVLALRYCSVWTVPPLFARRLFFRAAASEHSSFVQPPPRPLNAALYGWSRAEHALTRTLPAPFGSSLLAVAAHGGGGGRAGDGAGLGDGVPDRDAGNAQ